jgi:hypothetical protein
MHTQNTGAEVQEQTDQTTPNEEWGSLVFKQTLQNSSIADNIPEEYNAIYVRFTPVMRGWGQKSNPNPGSIIRLVQENCHFF